MKFFSNLRSIRKKMLFLFLPLAFLAIFIITSVNLLETKNHISSLLRNSAEKELRVISSSITSEFNAHSKFINSLSTLASSQNHQLNKGDYKKFIETLLPQNKNTYGMGVWFEPYAYNENTKYFGPYVFKNNGSLDYTEEYESDEYNYPNTEWYKKAKDLKEGIAWTEPYYDETLNITMITAAQPFYIDGKFAGVVTGDYDLSTIEDLVLNAKFLDTGYATLIDSKGNYLVHKDDSKSLKKNINNDESLNPLSKEMNSSKDGSSTISIDNISYESFYTTLENPSWKVILSAPEKELYSALSSLIFKSTCLCLFILIVYIIAIICFSTSFAKNITNFLSPLESLSKGDLSKDVKVSGNDELSKMSTFYNIALQKLRNIMDGISTNAETLTANAEELAASAQESSKSISSVSHSIKVVADNSIKEANYTEAVSSSADNINSQIEDINNNIKIMMNSSASSSQLAQNGRDFISKVINQMDDISKQVSTSSAVIYELNKKSKKIEEIITLISDIAEQTNLLSLNAAIEAARAGEHGKGFAIVAEEIRNLAEVVGKSSEDVSFLIKEIQGDINSSVESMEFSTNSTKVGINIAKETGDVFKNIYDSIYDVNSRSSDISNSVSLILVQAKEMNDTVKAIRELSSLNKDTAQNVSNETLEQLEIIGQISQATDALANMAVELQNSVSVFTS